MGIFSRNPPKGKTSQRVHKTGRTSTEKQGHVKSHNESHSARRTTKHVSRRKSF